MESSYFSVVMVSLISLALVLFHSTKHFEVEAHDQRNISFKVDLIHRDSTISPFYNASETNSDRLRNAILRSMSRVNHFDLLASSQPNTIQSDVIPNGGNYLMKLSIGTPPVEVLAVADTGSDLTWTQCKPCPECYMQDAPLFDPQHSSTYKSMPCNSNYCQALPRSQCLNSLCEYSHFYGDGSYTEGDLANEDFTFSSTNGQSVPIPNFVFGCGHRNGGTFNGHGSGLVGLGGGALSLVSQLSEEIDAKFSYCLVPMFDKSTSKLNFGSSATISSPGMVSVPLAPTDSNTFYSLTLEGISFGNDRIDNVGNIIIDSGTTLTLLNENLYTQLESMVKGAVNRPPIYVDGNYPFCYDAKEELTIPETTFHFKGADLKLGRMNVFFRASEDLLCFSMAPSRSISIFGNLAQVNFQVEYDLNAKKVSFAPADCTMYNNKSVAVHSANIGFFSCSVRL